MVHSTNPTDDRTYRQTLVWKKRLETQCGLEEIKAICWQLLIDPEQLRHETKLQLAMELPEYLRRHGRLAELEPAFQQQISKRKITIDVYRQELLKQTRYIMLTGIPLPPDAPQIPLDKIYIKLQAIAEEEQHRAKAAVIEALKELPKHENGTDTANSRIGVQELGQYFYKRTTITQDQELSQPIDPQEAVAMYKRLVILGAPGAGKSTLLRFLARREAEKSDGLVPILISLRDFAISYSNNRALHLQEFAIEKVAGVDNYQLRQALEVLVTQQRVLWLLDALDETYQHTEEIVQEIHQLPGPMLLTSRPIGYPRGMLNTLPHFEVMALTAEKVDQFLFDWMSVFTEQSITSTAVGQRVNWLQGQLNARPHLRTLTHNPLLLTFMVGLASQPDMSELPTNRAGLYALYLEKLRDWEIERIKKAYQNLHPPFRLGGLSEIRSRAIVTVGLHYLGWTLHLNYYGGRGKESPTHKLLTSELATYLTTFEKIPAHNAKQLALEILRFWLRAGMVDNWKLEGSTYLAFRHLTFQEYTAACCLKKAWEKNPKGAWAFLKPRLHHPAWQEPLLLSSNLLSVHDREKWLHYLYKGVSQDEHILQRDVLLAGAILGENPGHIGKTAQHVVKRLAWLGRTHDDRITVALALTCLSLMLVMFITLDLGQWMVAVVGLVLFFTVTFTVDLMIPVRILLGWPLRRKGLLTTPVESVYECLGNIGTAAVPYLLKALQDKERWRRKVAAVALGRIGDTTAVPYLIVALQDRFIDVRRVIIDALGEIGDATAVPHLLSLLDSYLLRRWVALALGKIGDKRAVPSLMRLLQDKSSWLPEVAIALGNLGDKTAVPDLLQLLRTKTLPRRAVVVTALGKIGDTAVVEDLIIALKDKDISVRREAATVLGQLGDKTIVPSLILLLKDRNEHESVQFAAATALKRIKNRVSLPQNILIQNMDLDTWWNDFDILSESDHKSYVLRLITALQDWDWDTRKKAAMALGKIGDEMAVFPLIAALGDWYKDVRDAANYSLKQMSVESVPRLIATLQSESDYMRRSSVVTLADIGDKTAVPHLIIALQDRSTDVREAAAIGLGQLKDKTAVPHLIINLQDKELNMRKAAAYALGQIGDPHAISPLTKALRGNDDVTRFAAAVALKNIALTTNDIPTAQKLRTTLLPYVGLIDQLKVSPIANAAQLAFRASANRLTELEVAQLQLEDPLLPQSTTFSTPTIRSQMVFMVMVLFIALVIVGSFVIITIHPIVATIDMWALMFLTTLIFCLLFVLALEQKENRT